MDIIGNIGKSKEIPTILQNQYYYIRISKVSNDFHRTYSYSLGVVYFSVTLKLFPPPLPLPSTFLSLSLSLCIQIYKYTG